MKKVDTAHERAGMSSKEAERLDRTLAMLPADATRALEVGFRDLRVTRLLAARLDLVSVDLPATPPAGAGDFKLAFANIKALPFADRHFELVICTEVIEHLPDDVLASGVRELARVCGRYLLVSVPFEQRVRNQLFRCAACGLTENSMGHVRQLGKENLLGLFPDFEIHAEELVGSEPGYAPDWLYTVSRQLGNVWYPHSDGVCPRCSVTGTPPAPNHFGWFLQRTVWRLEARRSSRPAWLVMLFCRPQLQNSGEL